MTRPQLDLFGGKYPRTPGFKRQPTSRAAAEGIAEKAPLLRDRVLAEIKRKPSTPEQVALAIGEPLLNVRPRCSELVKLKLIEDTGVRREALGGRQAIVWKAVTR